jgi:hypothetical protein
MTIPFIVVGAAALLGLHAPPIFRFETEELWLNLHHFLYVLGRAEAQLPDATRRAVAEAPNDAERGMAKLTDDERRVWIEAVQFYAEGLSRKDAIFDDPLPSIANALARARDDSTFSDTTIDAKLLATLQRAAPVYRKAWWTAHRAANRARIYELSPLVDTYGNTVLDFVTKAYGMPWLSSGYTVHFSAYSNWAGAYSTKGNLLVMSSLDPETRGSSGLEIVFHEGMHQWDDSVFLLLREHARSFGRLVPNGLSHAMIFYTAGDAVKRTVANHVPYAETAGMWQRDPGHFHQALVTAWQPHLDGRTSRDDALRELVRLTATERRP